MSIEKIIKEKKGTIVDVRSPGEFSGGNIVGSINIPLQQISQRMEELNNCNNLSCCAVHRVIAADKHISILLHKGLSVSMEALGWK